MKTRTIRCAECTAALTVEVAQRVPLTAQVYKAGWSTRGSVAGPEYFCAQHPPNYGGKKVKKETEEA